ncbi:uncharacterized protein CTRU02_203437 [Colletotrichum truncatum]|uniref:Uncharacterized protein n=1 Tax=Colletotrichum truncatum TaxID=5467 RepID=A0ACC3Z9A9_COLTU|nr:uncharacterized protein CTRU02_05819 [Colletotrichum truncatum]KAF6793564.1 hypothetical protein CTRU02_05819 [Colletotrichum truncatum]
MKFTTVSLLALAAGAFGTPVLKPFGPDGVPATLVSTSNPEPTISSEKTLSPTGHADLDMRQNLRRDDEKKMRTSCFVSPTSPFVFMMTYEITAENVDNVSKVCRSLRENLRQFFMCLGPHDYECSETERGKLSWKFEVSMGCEPAMVGATWWDATENKFGPLACYAKNAI